MRLSKWGQTFRKHATGRSVTTTCRGSTISLDQLQRYTNGCFLINEAHAFSRRHLEFNVDELCSLASRIGSKSAIREIEKLEGGFSKALLLKKTDGSELVAKLPFKIAGPSHYTTASEVAVLQYVSQHTEVPVPKVLAWNSDASNAIGSEYVIMEKAPGVQLNKIWADMPDYDHFVLIKNLCALESQLAAIEFPAHGSLYLRESLKSNDGPVPLEPSSDPDGRFCIGPSCERAWDEAKGDLRHKGPWLNLKAFGQALVHREISGIERTPAAQETGTHSPGSIASNSAILRMAEEVMARISPESLPGRFSKPTLWHTDLHLGNIYVSEEDHTKIVSIIDWQSVVISPLLCQVRFPEFLELPEGYEVGGPVPERPSNLDQMDEDDRMLAEHEHKQACMAKAYEAASGFKNKQVYKALQLPSYFKDLFERCGEASEEGIVPLRACLIEISKVWEDVGLEGECPINFTAEELAAHEREFEEYSNFHKIRAIAREYLDTDSEGWLPPGADVEMKRRQNKELLELMMERSAEYGMTAEEVRKMWPF
ncbi:hypothetical protein CBER1_07207 [Cercospora berteroae]|uniref:Altered inheritance of mitochondria protein 9, mitochondrial n=1 Tax=Cercospora berteroae TaxID=357750 RepID=A0A2S6BRY3_9PEZI|nr:hypothetical protein CBER1_07207 [Cercospora berteroae]